MGPFRAGSVHVVEKTLQDDRRGVGIHVAIAVDATARFAHACLGLDGCEGLIHEHHGKTKTRREAAGEFCGKPGHFVLATISVVRKSHDKTSRPPLGNQSLDGSKADLVRLGGNCRDRVRKACSGLSHGNAQALLPEVKSEKRSRKQWGLRWRRRQACPASSERFMAETPSALRAAP
jgi:hypothetical protein